MRWLLLLCLAATCGCSTTRFALVDLDLRDAEQIKAGYAEAAVPFLDPVPVPEPVVQAESIGESLLSMLPSLRGRLRILSFESKDQPRE